MKNELQPDDVISILKKINIRLRSSTDGLDKINNVLVKWHDYAQQYHSNLNYIIPSQIDNNDPFLTNIINLLKYETGRIQDFCVNLKNKITCFLPKEISSINKDRVNIKKDIKKLVDPLEYIWKYVASDRNKVDQAKNQLIFIDDEYKKTKQLNYIKSLIDSSQRNENRLSDVFDASHKGLCCSINPRFLDIELRRMNIEASAFTNLSQILRELSNLCISNIDNLVEKVDRIDINDRATRFVNRINDPKEEIVKETDNVIYAYAINNFYSENLYDLSFHKGEKILVLVQHSSGWWEGELDGRRGFFPSTFVVVPNANEDYKVYMYEKCSVRRDYIPVRNNELRLLIGDSVDVEYIVNDTCYGTNLGTNESGFFPAKVVGLSGI